MSDNITVKSFPASEGESFLITITQSTMTTNIIIDCGYTSTARLLIDECKKINLLGQHIDLLILTHIDNDHINGARTLLNEIINNKIIKIKQIWYNDYFMIYKCVNKILGLDIYKSSNVVLDKIINTPYPENSTIYKEKNVGFQKALFLEDILTKPEVLSIWNTDFDYQYIAIDDKPIKKTLNNEVVLYILGPYLNTLKQQFYEWRDYLNKTNYSLLLDNNIDLAKAFEISLMLFHESSNNFSKKKCGSSANQIAELISFENFDTTTSNRSSISIVIEFNNKKLLFLGDSSPIDLENTLLEYSNLNGHNSFFDLVKLPHHGSKRNWSIKLNEIAKSKKYLIATNGNRHNHPDIETIMKIISRPGNKEIIFNYKPERLLHKLNNLKVQETYTYTVNYENSNRNQLKVQEISL
ncbi:MAG: hypothetical protein PWP53_968 [Lacrimispora sp.]|nr:hypothetical protein [Lacrimispora sp.]